jgi:hypothetical protein
MRYELIRSEDAPEAGAPPNTHGLAAYDDSGLVAYVGILGSVTLDPLWVRPDKRKSPFILRRLWEKTKEFLVSSGATSVGGVTLKGENAELVEKIAVRLAGAKPTDVRLLHIDLT